MIGILKEAEKKKKSRGGKPNNLTIEDKLLMSLEYIIEYGTYFHIDSSYCISEIYRNIRWIEDTLIKHPDFSLPGIKSLLNPSIEYELVTIDATESPVERLKKNKKDTIQERKRNIR